MLRSGGSRGSDANGPSSRIGEMERVVIRRAVNEGRGRRDEGGEWRRSSGMRSCVILVLLAMTLIAPADLASFVYHPSSIGCEAYAEDVSVRATVNRTRVAVSDTVELSLSVNGAQDVPAPNLSIDGFLVRYVGPSTYISVVNRQVSTSITHIYSLLAQQEGHFTIGPISVEVGGQAYQTEPFTIEVVPSSARAPATGLQLPPSADATHPEISQALQLKLDIEPRRLYVNQAVSARLQLFVRGAPLHGIEMPTLQAEGFLVQPFGKPQQSEVVIGGQLYTLLEFTTVVVPIRTGTLSLGPGAIECRLVARSQGRSPLGRRSLWPFGEDPFEEFFGRTEIYPATVTAKPVEIEVLPLPEEERPGDFDGAVGRFALDVAVTPSEVAVGEPITVTMAVRGEGNFDTVTPPRLTGDLSRFKVYEPQRWRGASEEAESQRVFEQVLIPLDPSVRAVPTVQWSFFDPQARRYQTVTKGPLPITVTPAPAQEPVAVVGAPSPSGEAASEPEVLGRDIVYIKEQLGTAPRSGRWYADPAWLWWQITPLALLALGGWRRRRLDRLAADPAMVRASGVLRRVMTQCQAARRLAQEGKTREGYAEIFRAIQRYVGDRFNLTAEGLTRVELERYLRSRRAPEALVQQLLEVVDRCDAARFAPSSEAAGQAAATVAAAEGALRQLERWRPS